MNNLWDKIESHLLDVQQPSQYIGGEVNSVVKDHETAKVKMVLAFPDTYRIGMSHWGLQILYGVINREPDMLAERVFAPWLDMESALRKNHLPLFSLETHRALADFDIIGFSLQHELCYTNVLAMLDLAGIPFLSRERTDEHPLIIAGGPAAFNPEPLSDFIDLFVIGDGEEKIIELLREFIRLKDQKTDRLTILKELARKISGIYVPALYEVTYQADGTLKAFRPKEAGLSLPIKKAIVENLDDVYYPVKPIVPFAEAVHDRITLEVMRGCPHSCRFCISSVIKSPVRYRSVTRLLDLAEEIYKNTGYDEISLLSLSSGDYPWLEELMVRLNARWKSKRVGISLPSLRVDARLKGLPPIINAVRKAGFTLAPEAGREALRKIISKDIMDEDLFEAVRSAYQNGWKSIKLYFMIGLPGETTEDIQAISQMLKRIIAIGRETQKQMVNMNVTISPFSPKAHTAFQWCGMESMKSLKEKQAMLKSGISSRHIRLKFHSVERSFLEGVFARGDRRLAPVILAAYQGGCKFDSWDESFDFTKWQSAFAESGVDPLFYTRPRSVEEILPWSHIASGLSPDALIKDRNEVILSGACI